jgi:MYXO-CTERM domain-containing protein
LLIATSAARAASLPSLTPERQLTGAQLPPANTDRLSAAFDGTGFLLVWADQRGSSLDIYGARISRGGELLEPGAFPISTAVNEQSSPDVAFNGTHFLVTWNDHRTGNAWSIYAARVSTTGTVLDATGLPLSIGTTGEEKFVPSVACEGAECLVIWSERRSGSSWDILGVTVDASGAVTSAADQVISGVNRGQFVPELTRERTGYFAAWSDQRDFPDYGIHGASITRSGQAGNPSGMVLGSRISDTFERPALAWDGTNTWVAWTNTLLTPSTPTIYLRTTQGAAVAVTSGELTRRPALAFDGTWVWLAYESELPTAEHGVAARRFTTAGQAVDTAPFSLSGTDPGASVPHLASDGQGHVLVAYASHAPGAQHDTLDRLFYRVATALPGGAECSQDTLCASGTCTSGRCCDRRCDQACETCLHAEGASADGVCGPATRVCRAAASVCDVEERCDGKATTCPADERAKDETACGTELVCRAGGCQPLTPPEPLELRVGCGCSGGGEGPWLLVLPGLLAGAWRRRVSPRCCAESRRSG